MAAEAEVGPCEYAGCRVVLLQIKAYLKRQKTSSSGIVEGSLNRNFRQYGQLKSRAEQSSQQKEDAIARKSEERRYIRVREVATCCVFSMIRVSGQSKSRPVKAAGAEVGAERRHQKLHAAAAKRTLGSESVQNTSFSEHFLKFCCRSCGETRIGK